MAVSDGGEDPEPVPLQLIRPFGGREQGVGFLKEHGGRLTRERIGSRLAVQAEAGEGSNDGLREHEVSHYFN